MLSIFALTEGTAGAILAVLLAYKFIRHGKIHHLAWMFSMVFWSAFEFGVSPLLGLYPAALWGAGMLFLLRGFELFPKIEVQKSWPKYFLLYTLIVYGALIGAGLITGALQTVATSAWVLLVIPGSFIAISGSISSFFLDRKRNTLIAIAILLSIAGEQIGLILWDSPANWMDTVAEILIGAGLLIAIEPLRKPHGKR